MKSRHRSEFNFWPSIADMILAVLMTFLILWFAQQLLFLNQLGAATGEEFRSDKPPIITLDELSGYNFETGKANLSSHFKLKLEAKIGDIKQDINKYKANVIEVIGHTDGQVAGGQKSDLDYSLEKVVAGSLPVENLRYGSNADLGLMRALSVVLFLRQQPELEGIKFRVYSAAQLILPDGELAVEQDRGSDKKRRRIELRFTRL